MLRIYRWIEFRILFFWLLFNMPVPFAFGQEYLVSVQHYSVPEGLSHRNVQVTLQDQQGFIWAAAFDGLNRFDGSEFLQFKASEHGFSASGCVLMLEDRQGQLWLFYPRHSIADDSLRDVYPVDLFYPTTGGVKPLEEVIELPFAWKERSHMGADPSGNVYILLHSGEVYRSDGIGIKKLFTLDTTENGYLSVSTDGMIALLDGKRLTQFDSSGKKLHQAILPETADFIRTANGQFWVGKFNPESGLALWSIPDGQTVIPFHFSDKNEQPVRFRWDTSFEGPFYPDKEGRWWVYSGSQLLLFDQEGKFLYDFADDLKAFNFSFPISISFDSQNTAWFSTTHGLFSISIRKNPFTNFLTSKDLVDTRGIISDEMGQVHAIQQGEIWRLNKDSGATVLPGVNAWLAAARDINGKFWLGNYNYNVQYYDPVNQEAKTYLPPVSTTGNGYQATRAILPDLASGRIWVGLYKGGLAYIDTTQQVILPFKAYNQFQQLRQASVHCFLKTESGIWLGTSQGLYLIGPEKEFIAGVNTQNSSLPYDDIYHIHRDKEGIFWLATNGGGLIRWNRKNDAFRQFTDKEGLSNNVVYAVYEDETKHLWLPSNNGLMRFSKDSFQIQTYMPRDGLPHEEFNFSSHFQAADGRLFFGGLGGVVAFYPKEIYEEEALHSLQLGISRYLELNGATGAFVDKTAELLSKKEIKLAPNNKSFLLKILFPDYQSPKDNRFAYRIEGLHYNWIYQVGNTIQINSLPYGSYKLRIKAQGASGLWTTSELYLPLTVVRPFYLRWWFLAACIVLAISLLWWRIQLLKRAAIRLEAEVAKRTQQIEQDKLLIEKQTTELRKLDKLKSRFFANMAHELRTPLALILSPLKRLLKEVDFDNRTFTTLKLIQSNAKSLLRLAEDILDIDKLEEHRLRLQEETVTFYPLIRRLVSTFESHAEAGGIELHFHYHPEQYLHFQLDANKFERILFNLISNALKFTQSSGKVTVSVTDTVTHIIVAVTDTGRGIHPNDLPHIFDRFYQSKHQGGEAEGGAGIGLALASEYARLMGGKLSVESQLNKGSTFVFEFPKKEVFGASEKSHPIPETDIPALVTLSEEGLSTLHYQRSTILIVEDNSDMRRFLQEILSEHSQVYTAGNGAQALEQLKQLAASSSNDKTPDLIITDLMMPEMDGYSLLKALKADIRWQNIPVIVLTARASLSDRLTVLRIGIDDYLAKPFETEELLVRSANLIQNRQQRHRWRQQQADKLGDKAGGNDHFPNLEELLQAEKSSSADQQWLERVEAIAFQQIGPSDFGSEDLAHELALSSRQLRRKLKQLTGMATTDYLREIRLQKARRLLENSACSKVAEACYAVGLSDPKHFTKIFRKRFGRNPSDFLSKN